MKNYGRSDSWITSLKNNNDLGRLNDRMTFLQYYLGSELLTVTRWFKKSFWLQSLEIRAHPPVSALQRFLGYGIKRQLGI